MIYTPDDWVILRITSEKYGSIDKILCSWCGGYGGSDSWKLSSGIVSHNHFQNYLDFHQESRSVYRCYTNSERMSRYMEQMLNHFRTTIPMGNFDVISLSDYDNEILYDYKKT